MQSAMFFHLIKTGLFFLCLGWCSAQAAEFTADLIVTAPGSEVVYDLKVKNNLYRIEKVKGLASVPCLSTIYNRTTRVSWGLNPQTNQYIEQADPADTLMMNPIAGWETMRSSLKAFSAGTENINGYVCQILEYRQPGETRARNRVWVSSELNFPLKEVSHAVNGDATLILKNIRQHPQDPTLFKIPKGYTRVTAPGKFPPKAVKHLPAVTSAIKGNAPWGRRIGVGGQLQVKFDPKRPVKMIFLNHDTTASSCTYTTYQKGDEHTPMQTGHISLSRKGQQKKVRLSQNKQTEWAIIQGEKGLVYVSMVNEKDPFLSDPYALQEGYLTVKNGQGISVDPGRPLIITLLGDSQDTPNSEIALICYQQQYQGKLFEKKMKIANNETKTWEFSPDQKIQTCEILVGRTGGIKYRTEQPALVP